MVARRRIGFNRADRWVLVGILLLIGAGWALLRFSDAMVSPPRPRISESARPVLGLSLAAVGTGVGSVVVRAVTSPAREAGIRSGDRILALDDLPLRTPDDASRAVQDAPSGHIFRIEARRGAPGADESALLAQVEPQIRPISPDDEGLAFENVTFRNTWGATLRGWYIPPPAGADGERAAAVAYGHGNASDRRQWLATARAVHDAGLAQLLFDFSGRGESDGEVITLGARESGDLRSALDFLAARPEVDAARLGLVGKSMGGAAAILAAADDPRVRALVIDSAFSDLTGIVDHALAEYHAPRALVRPLLLRLAGWRAAYDPSALRPLDAMRRVRAPVLLLHGEVDTIVPIFQAEALAAAAAGHCTLVRLPAIDHNTPRPPETVARIATFLARVL